MRNHSYENDFNLHENETACRTHFHMKGFALRLALKQRHKRTGKWPIVPLVATVDSTVTCIISKASFVLCVRILFSRYSPENDSLFR